MVLQNIFGQPPPAPTPRMKKLLKDAEKEIKDITQDKKEDIPGGLDAWMKNIHAHFELVNSKRISQTQRAKYFTTIMTIFQYGGKEHRWAREHCWAVFALFATKISPDELCNLDFHKEAYAEWWKNNFSPEQANKISLYILGYAEKYEIEEWFIQFHDLNERYEWAFKDPNKPWPPKEFEKVPQENRGQTGRA